MVKGIFLFIIISICCKANAQNGFIVLRKNHKTVQYFSTGGHITFQQSDGEWMTGILTKITADSFYLTQEIIHYYAIGTDTLRFKGLRFALKDVYAMPTKRQITVQQNGQVKVIMGHERWVWVRNGFLFQAGGAGYAGLNIANDLINHDPPITRKKLPGILTAAGVFLFGQLLHLKFDPYLHIGKKYQLESIVF